jgi:molybdopterin biosynthesis enzyme
MDLWRVAVQPGKPFAFGRATRPGAADGAPPVLFFGLPGNPVSSFVTFELFVRPAIRRLQGRSVLFRPVDRAVLTEAVTKSSGRRAFLRVRAEREADGTPRRDERGRVVVVREVVPRLAVDGAAARAVGKGESDRGTHGAGRRP